MAPTRVALLVAVMAALAAGQPPSSWTCPGSQVEIAVARGGVTRQQRLCAHAGALYLPLVRRATSMPATCDEARELALPNVGCNKIGGNTLTYFAAVALAIRNGSVFINVVDRTHAWVVGALTGRWSGHVASFGEAGACNCRGGGSPGWGSIDLRDTAFALDTSAEVNFRSVGAGPYNNELRYSDDNQRADFTADGCCGGTAFHSHYVGEVNHPDDTLLPVVGSVVTPSPVSSQSTTQTSSPSNTATSSTSGTGSSSPSSSATPSSTPVADCSGHFRTLRYTDLDGDVISVHGGMSEAECQVRCCRMGNACSAYVLGLVTNECFLLANSSSYNAAHYFHAGVRARDGEVGGGGS